jgi:hypothetical protein
MPRENQLPEEISDSLIQSLRSGSKEIQLNDSNTSPRALRLLRSDVIHIENVVIDQDEGSLFSFHGDTLLEHLSIQKVHTSWIYKVLLLKISKLILVIERGITF